MIDSIGSNREKRQELPTLKEGSFFLAPARRQMVRSAIFRNAATSLMVKISLSALERIGNPPGVCIDQPKSCLTISVTRRQISRP